MFIFIEFKHNFDDAFKVKVNTASKIIKFTKFHLHITTNEQFTYSHKSMTSFYVNY